MKFKITLMITKLITKHPLMGLVFVSFILLLPQIFSQNMIIGNDSIFHFNRFYDTAMQIKNHNYQYFISMYGFQASGRIVNALYSPYLAYIHGFLLLIAKTWFNYQVLSNFILYISSEFSMYLFLKRLNIRHKIRFTIAVVYLSTFAVQYWITRQGFSSWGAALFPISLTPVITMNKDNTIKPLELGFYTALVCQVHFLTALFLVMTYLPYYLTTFIRSKNRSQLLAKTFLSIGYFILLTLNIWVSFIHVYSGNSILAPFVNLNMARSTITFESFYCLFTPFFLLFILLTTILIFFKEKKSLTPFLKVTILTSLFFFILASNLIPWKFLVKKKVIIAELIQFPFRFVIPATVLLLIAFASLLNEYKFERLRKHRLKLMVCFSVIQTLILQIVLLSTWSKPTDYIFAIANTYISDFPAEKVKNAFYSENLGLALTYIQKSTPDYLPVYKEHQGSKYKLYKAQVLDSANKFNKNIINDKLTITWKSQEESVIELPVVYYTNTHLKLNDAYLAEGSFDYSAIGTIKLTQCIGENKLELTYQQPKFLPYSIGISLAGFSYCLFSFKKSRTGKIDSYS